MASTLRDRAAQAVLVFHGGDAGDDADRALAYGAGDAVLAALRDTYATTAEYLETNADTAGPARLSMHRTALAYRDLVEDIDLELRLAAADGEDDE